MDHCEVVDAIPILDPVDVKEAYSHIALRYHSVQWYVQSHGWHDARFRSEKNLWKEALFFTMKLARQKLCKYCAEVTPLTGMLHNSAHILQHFRKLQSFGKWDKGMDINPDNETSYTT